MIFIPLLCLYVSYREKQAVLFNIALIVMFFGFIRLGISLLYRKFAPPSTPKSIKFWKEISLAAIMAYSTPLGIFAYVAITQTDDYGLHLIAISVLAGYAAGSTGCNAALQAGFPATLITTLLPLAAALAQRDDPFYRLMAIAVVIYFVGMRAISKSTHKQIVSLVYSSEEKEVLLQAVTEKSERFDAAFSNMPHGLAMVDAECRVVVANDKFRELLKLPKSGDDNAPIESLFAISARNGILPPDSHDLLDRMVRDSAGNGSQQEIEIGAVGGQTLSLAFQPKARGGCVITIMDVTDKKAVERITHLAHHDKLTGLPNRRFFDEQFASTLHAARQAGDRLAVMALDLDRFKAVNDTLGHPVGDELLRVASSRISRAHGAAGFRVAIWRRRIHADPSFWRRGGRRRRPGPQPDRGGQRALSYRGQ